MVEMLNMLKGEGMLGSEIRLKLVAIDRLTRLSFFYIYETVLHRT